MEEQETIEGFNIPLRELTLEESLRPITLARFNDFHYEVGEDFIDQIGSVNTARIAFIFAGFAIAKHPDWSIDLLDQCNRSSVYIQLIKDVYAENTSDSDQDDTFYSEFAEFLNLTIETKKRVNQVLIQVEEYYAE
jgi:hypothetical protein